MASSRSSSNLPSSSKQPSPSKARISLDGWAVLIALLAAVLVRAGVLKAVPW